MRHRIYHALWVARPLFLVLGLACFAAIPTAWLERAPSLCTYKRLFGIECLGCGMTRAMSCLLHGDLAAALAYNKLVMAVFPLMVLLLLRDVASRYRYFRGS
jgi:hypothetical protein